MEMISFILWLALGLGLLSWGLGAAALGVKAHRVYLCPASLTCCSVALWLAVVYVWCLTAAGNSSALEDTMGGLRLAATTLLVVTLLLNGAALLRGSRKERS